MANPQLVERLTHILALQLGEYVVPKMKGFTDETSMRTVRDELDLDSLDEIEILMAVEGEFETELPDDLINAAFADDKTWGHALNVLHHLLPTPEKPDGT